MLRGEDSTVTGVVNRKKYSSGKEQSYDVRSKRQEERHVVMNIEASKVNGEGEKEQALGWKGVHWEGSRKVKPSSQCKQRSPKKKNDGCANERTKIPSSVQHVCVCNHEKKTV